MYLAIQAKYSIQKQPGFFDLQFRLEDLSKIGDPLIELNKAIEWEKFAAILQAARIKDCMSRGVVGQAGRKPFPLYSARVRRRDDVHGPDRTRCRFRPATRDVQGHLQRKNGAELRVSKNLLDFVFFCLYSVSKQMKKSSS